MTLNGHQNIFFQKGRIYLICAAARPYITKSRTVSAGTDGVYLSDQIVFKRCYISSSMMQQSYYDKILVRLIGQVLCFNVIKSGNSGSITSFTNRRHIGTLTVETNLKNTCGTIISRCTKSKSLYSLNQRYYIISLLELIV